MNNYCVYKHTFPNEKVYIGVTCKKPEDRWENGKGYIGQSRMIKAIIEYGWDNIKHEVIFDNLSREEAEQIEIELIAKYQSNDSKFGYNVQDGGNLNNYDGYITQLDNGETLWKNQLAVIIHKPSYKKEKILSVKVGVNELMEASKNLKGTTFKLYTYLCCYKNESQIAFSPTDVCCKTGITRRSYQSARTELKEMGYLVCRHGNLYDFYTTPQLPDTTS